MHPGICAALICFIQLHSPRWCDLLVGLWGWPNTNTLHGADGSRSSWNPCSVKRKSGAVSQKMKGQRVGADESQCQHQTGRSESIGALHVAPMLLAAALRSRVSGQGLCATCFVVTGVDVVLPGCGGGSNGLGRINYRLETCCSRVSSHYLYHLIASVVWLGGVVWEEKLGIRPFEAFSASPDTNPALNCNFFFIFDTGSM